VGVGRQAGDALYDLFRHLLCDVEPHVPAEILLVELDLLGRAFPPATATVTPPWRGSTTVVMLLATVAAAVGWHWVGSIEHSCLIRAHPCHRLVHRVKGVVERLQVLHLALSTVNRLARVVPCATST